MSLEKSESYNENNYLTSDIERLESVFEYLVQDEKSQENIQNLLNSLKPLASNQIDSKLINRVYLDLIKLLRSGHLNYKKQEFIEKILSAEKLNPKIR